VKARVTGEEKVIVNLLKNLASSRKKSRLVVRIREQGGDFHEIHALADLARSF
jgi:hypothetical protein